MAVTMEMLADEKGIAVISFGKEPVNSMDLEFWRLLKSTFQAAEADKNIRGVIFQSTLKKHLRPTVAAVLSLLFIVFSIYGSRLATVAAINGACPAGGCMLAMCCDWRIITYDGSMGLNEVALGIPVPRVWCELMAKLIGLHPAEDAERN
eukprot:g1721.t1